MTPNFLLKLFNIILPPRRTQLLVGALALDDLLVLQTAEGLPYADEAVRALVWELKYYGNKHAAMLAGKILAEELLAIAAEELGRPLLVPVPMHKTRKRERGHNQTELLCEAALQALGDFPGKKSSGLLSPGYALAGQTIFPGKSPAASGSAPYDYTPRALTRIKATPEQQKLDRAKRLKNVAGSMQVENPELVEGRTCVVVDDVTTTGATLAEAKRALKAAGARRVHTVALAQS
ncbi:MAG: ComF family protein [Candidatus Pacebacteria bacterium]|nr:ComF family protein [Candidatus Paceibacterota bacterium]